MKVTMQKIGNSTYVNIEGEGYQLSVQTKSGTRAELVALAEEARHNAAKSMRRYERLMEASRHKAVNLGSYRYLSDNKPTGIK